MRGVPAHNTESVFRGVNCALTNYFQIMGRKCICLHPKCKGNGVNLGIYREPENYFDLLWSCLIAS